LTTYVLRRLLLAVIVLILVSLLLFIAVHLLPGDPIYMIMSSGQVDASTTAEVEAIRHQYGLDRPLFVQYVSWLNQVVHGELGVSIIKHMPVSDMIRDRIPVSFYLGGLSFVIGIPLGIGAGIICAVRRGSRLDTVVTSLANIGICIPSFWLAILLIYLLGLQLRLLPVFGFTPLIESPVMSIKQTIMPVFCLAIAPVAMNCRLTRSSMLEVIHQDYIRTAWAKGLKERVVIFRHALKNGLLPILTMLGMGLAGIIGGSVFIEQVYGIPGMGRLALDAVNAHDYPVLQANVLIFATLIMLSNLIVDLCYGWLDPRVRYN
jgi:peptide/nickel transport system permease protein